jgi:hypothetical protein
MGREGSPLRYAGRVDVMVGQGRIKKTQTSDTGRPGCGAEVVGWRLGMYVYTCMCMCMRM